MINSLHTISIWVIGDGKAGHQNQSLGLAEAICRHLPAKIHRVSLSEAMGCIGRIRAAISQGKSLPKPDLILAAGHATHASLVLLGIIHGAPTVVLMKPSLPTCFFGHCLISEHDLGSRKSKNTIPIKGALNRVQSGHTKSNTGLMLIGGASKHHQFDETAVRSAIHLILNEGARHWYITNSRRSPKGFLESIQHPRAEIFPHQDTQPEWLPQHLAEAPECWVTEESISMVCEAASSGASVGLLPMKPINANGKIDRAIDVLCESGYTMRFSDWLKTRQLSHVSTPLQETDRCARMIINTYFPS